MDKDPDIKQDFIDRYGKEEGEKIYFATIRKRSMKEESEEELQEMSAMALGAAEVGTHPGKEMSMSKKKKKKK